MSENYKNEPLLDMYIFETEQLLEQLEQLMLSCEEANGFSGEAVDEIFRMMHTIKGSSAMMMYNGISKLAHCLEDLFHCLRNGVDPDIDTSEMADLVFEGIDFIKQEIQKIKTGEYVEDDPSEMIERISKYVGEIKEVPLAATVREHDDTGIAVRLDEVLSEGDSSIPKHAYKAVLYFEDGCEMENIRAFSVVNQIKDIASEICHNPGDLLDNSSCEEIRRKGFSLSFRSDLEYGKIQEVLAQTIFLKQLNLSEADDGNDAGSADKTSGGSGKDDLGTGDASGAIAADNKPKPRNEKEAQLPPVLQSHQNILSVDVLKLDRLMDLVGEMVIAEAMVVQNPDLDGLELESFQKAAQRLDKITKEIQDMVMSIRMVSLAATFHKMNRIVRDMCKKLDKEARLVIIGEETEVDKNIIEHISDPLMHLVRNAVDHGIESMHERQAAGKDRCGTVMLEAKSAGSDVLITVRDDGRGLNREKILEKAREKGLIHKPEADMTDREVYNLILLPSFSTKENITEFSGRGVGMDVVAKNIEAIGGSVLVDSVPGSGSVITLKIPLTLAIIDGMNIKIGKSLFTLPTISIRESFRPQQGDTFTDPDGNEMIMVRGECYPILRLHQFFRISTDITDFSDGIIIMVEHDEKVLCLFADELLGQQQIVVKTLPRYIRDFKKAKRLAGCTLLGDGNISLILDISGLIYG